MQKCTNLFNKFDFGHFFYNLQFMSATDKLSVAMLIKLSDYVTCALANRHEHDNTNNTS